MQRKGQGVKSQAGSPQDLPLPVSARSQNGFCVRPEVFDLAEPSAAPLLSLRELRKLPRKALADAEVTPTCRLTPTQWASFAANHSSLSESQQSLLLSTFRALLVLLGFDERAETGAPNAAEQESVPLFPFLLFLTCHQVAVMAHRHRSVVAQRGYDDSFPRHASCPTTDPELVSPRKPREQSASSSSSSQSSEGQEPGTSGGKEDECLRYAREHLEMLMRTVCACCDGRTSLISRGEFDCLGVLLRSTVPGAQSLSGAVDAIVAEEGSRGLFDSSGMCCISTLANWLRDHAVRPPCDHCSAEVTFNVRRQRQTTAVSAQAADASPRAKKLFCVTECHDSDVYLFRSTARGAIISACQGGTVLISSTPVLLVKGCSGLSVIAACGRVFIKNCFNVKVFLIAQCPPVFLGYNTRVSLAPYCTHFPWLESHLQDNGLLQCLDPSRNHWDVPIVGDTLFSQEGNADTEEEAQDNPSQARATAKERMRSDPPSILPPCDFYEFFIPFTLPGAPENWAAEGFATLQAMLPTEYAEVLQLRRTAADQLRDTIASEVSPERRALLRKAVWGKFDEWLKCTGNMRRLKDLVTMSRIMQQQQEQGRRQLLQQQPRLVQLSPKPKQASEPADSPNKYPSASPREVHPVFK